jgi:Cu2+-exporting ATPase
MAGACFHCGEPVGDGTPLLATVGGQAHAVCCIGCRAAVEWIDGLGLADYYRLREGAGTRAAPADDFAEWDRPRLARRHVRELDAGRCEATVLVEGMHCSACAWLIERALSRCEGVHEATVSPLVQRVRVAFDPRRTRLSVLLAALARLGYRPHPLEGDRVDALRTSERRAAMKRLIVAGFGAMQAMMYAVALYAGAFDGIAPAVAAFLRWMGMLVATPVVLYAARPFFAGALREWRARRLSMDTPVALAIGAIYTGSVVATVLGEGEVYFDSVSMFVFLLLLGRYVELRARQRAGEVADALVRLQPATAQRLVDGTCETVGVHELEPGEVVRVGAGATIPVDGVLHGARCRVDESLLTGESAACLREAGDEVVAGSVALDGPIEVEVRRVGPATVLSTLARMVERAAAARPRVARLADAAAARFVLRVLAATGVVALAWMILDPSRAFASAVAVLVISCPCAFALAAPAALTRAVGVLARRGVMVVDADALEALARVERFVFDKTGTLTEPAIDLARMRIARGSRASALAAAAALEQGSTHPFARALRDAARGLALPAITAVRETGGGVAGHLGGRTLRLGRAEFALAAGDDGDALVLADDDGEIARFPVVERVRDGARAAIDALHAAGIACEIVSGDHAHRVRRVATTLGIAGWRAGATPADKLAHIAALRDRGVAVAAVGDGVNDGPVLGGADVAIALGDGAAIAQAASGIVLSGPDLGHLVEAREVARCMLAVVRRNLRWTLVYNLLAIPLAALGFVPPWLAAIGMSASSLIVVVNTFAIGHHRAARRPSAVAPAPPLPRTQPA